MDKYFDYFEEKYCCKTLDGLLGKEYIMKDGVGNGKVLRMKLEEGLELSKVKMHNKVAGDFDNKEFKDDVFKLGYCYDGYVKIFSATNSNEYTIKKGDMFIYTSLNYIEYFKFEYNECKILTIRITPNFMENIVNPLWKDKIVSDWHENMNNLLDGNTFLVDKASYKIGEIARQIDLISMEDMMDCMNLKLKAIEFLITIFEEKNNSDTFASFKTEELEKAIKAKEIIDKDIENTPTVKELAKYLNTSIYKLQKGFRKLTENNISEYIQKMRVKKAEYLLENTDMSIIQIANQIGYENPSKFAVLFKRYNKVSPLKYRKLKNRNKI